MPLPHCCPSAACGVADCSTPRHSHRGHAYASSPPPCTTPTARPALASWQVGGESQHPRQAAHRRARAEAAQRPALLVRREPRLAPLLRRYTSLPLPRQTSSLQLRLWTRAYGRVPMDARLWTRHLQTGPRPPAQCTGIWRDLGAPAVSAASPSLLVQRSLLAQTSPRHVLAPTPMWPCKGDKQRLLVRLVNACLGRSSWHRSAGGIALAATPGLCAEPNTPCQTPCSGQYACRT